MTGSEDESLWSPPFLNTDTSTTPVPYGDLHAVSPFVATPQAAIDLMLAELQLTDQDFLVDLGCGQGTINICAARDYGTRGLGVDIEPGLVAEAQVRAAEAGVAGLVEFRVEDVSAVELGPATAVVSFLVPRQLRLLQPALLRLLARGGRLACYHYRLVGIQPLRTLSLGGQADKQIFLY
jgi:hypothetical protein